MNYMHYSTCHEDDVGVSDPESLDNVVECQQVGDVPVVEPKSASFNKYSPIVGVVAGHMLMRRRSTKTLRQLQGPK